VNSAPKVEQWHGPFDDYVVVISRVRDVDDEFATRQVLTRDFVWQDDDCEWWQVAAWPSRLEAGAVLQGYLAGLSEAHYQHSVLRCGICPSGITV